MKLLLALLLLASLNLPAAEAPWISLFNGRDLSGWDKFLAPLPGTQKPLGWNNDPHNVFQVSQTDGGGAMHVSGQIYGSLTTKQSFTNFHFRLSCKWGPKRWPPRENVGRDSGILYGCIGEPNPHTGWMTSVECNVMEKGIGQWWSVNGAIIDVEGVRVTPEMEKNVPYKKEGAGETIIVYQPGAPFLTANPADGITPPFDDEKPLGQWNLIEVIYWGGQCLHLLNGKVNLALSNPRISRDGKVTPLRAGKIQLQSEAAECFFREVEVQTISGIPERFLSSVPAWPAIDKNFKRLLPEKGQEGWSQSGPGRFAVEQGVASAEGGMGLWWYTNQTFTNFVLRGEFLQEGEGADSGVFLRFPNPGSDPMIAVKKGHEMEIGNPKDQNPTWRTGSIYPFRAPAQSPTRPAGQWNDYEIICLDHDYSVRLNGQLVTTWSDPDRRSAYGYIGLQNYNDGKKVRFRNLRVLEVP